MPENESVNIEIRGAESVVEKLRRIGNINGVKKIVQQNGAELQEKAQRKAQFKGHYEGDKFVPPTGTLRRSIRLDIEDQGLTAAVSANTEYAAYVEYGTRNMAAQPYLRPALHEQAETFKNDLERFVNGKE